MELISVSISGRSKGAYEIPFILAKQLGIPTSDLHKLVWKIQQILGPEADRLKTRIVDPLDDRPASKRLAYDRTLTVYHREFLFDILDDGMYRDLDRNSYINHILSYSLTGSL
jgi:hypothetical protein